MISLESRRSQTATWVENVDPVTKLLLILAVLLGSFLYANLTYSVVVLGLTFLLMVSARIWRQACRLIEFSLFLIVTMVLIQGLFNPQNHTVLVTIFHLKVYQEGLLYALMLGSRLLAIIFATSFFIFTTTIAENTHYLEQVGVPYKVVYVLMSVCYVLPQMMQNMRQIQLAQRARGINTQRSLWQQARAVIPVLIPLVTKTLMQSVERATALQLRGFNNPQRRLPTQLTYQNERRHHRGMWLLIIGLGGWKVWMIINGLV